MSPTVGRRVARFALDCPCEACERWRARVSPKNAQESILRGLAGLPGEDERKMSDVEILWTARFVLRGAHQRFLESSNPTKRFAAVCPCPRCQAWRNRLLEEGELFQLPHFLEMTAGEETSP